MRLYYYSLILLAVLTGCLVPATAWSQSTHFYQVDQSFNPQDLGNGGDELFRPAAGSNYYIFLNNLAYTSTGKIIFSNSMFDAEAGYFRERLVSNLNRLNPDQTYDPSFNPSLGGPIANRGMVRWKQGYTGANANKYLGVFHSGNHDLSNTIVRFDENGQVDGSFQHTIPTGEYRKYYIPNSGFELGNPSLGQRYLASGKLLAYFSDESNFPRVEVLNEDGSTHYIWPRIVGENLSPPTHHFAERDSGKLEVLMVDISGAQISNTLTLRKSWYAGDPNSPIPHTVSVPLRTVPGKRLRNAFAHQLDPDHYYVIYQRFSGFTPEGWVLERYHKTGGLDNTFTPFLSPIAFGIMMMDGVLHVRSIDQIIYGNGWLHRFVQLSTGGTILSDVSIEGNGEYLAQIGPQGQILLASKIEYYKGAWPNRTLEYQGGRLRQYTATGREIPMAATSGGFNGPVEISIQPNGQNWVAAGYFTLYNTFSNNGFIKVKPSGPDTTFMGPSNFEAPLYKTGERIYGRQTGYTEYRSGAVVPETGFTRLLPNGKPDSTGGGLGQAVLEDGSLARAFYVEPDNWSNRHYEVAVLRPDGTVEGPEFLNSKVDFGGYAFARRDTNFTLATHWTGGPSINIKTPSLQSVSNLGVYPRGEYVIDDYGRVLAGKWPGPNGTLLEELRLYNNDLTLDSSFVTTEKGTPFTILPDGSVIIVRNDSLVRIFNNGQRDRSFLFSATGVRGVKATDDMRYIYITGTFFNFGGKASTRIARLVMSPAASDTCTGVAIASLSPTSGPEGTLVTVNGTGLDNVRQVWLNGTPLAYRHVSASQLSFTVPQGATSGKLKVVSGEDPDTCSNISPQTFLVQGTVAEVAMTRFGQSVCDAYYTDPQGAAPYANNQYITQTLTPGTVGAKLYAELVSLTLADQDQVYIYDDVTANGTKLLAILKAGSPATGKFQATNASGALTIRFYSNSAGTAQGFRFRLACVTGATVAVPEVVSFTPGRGANGRKITILGRNLASASSVRFNGVAASYIQSGQYLTATVPVGASTGRISVQSGNEVAISTADFVVTDTVFQATTQTTLCSGVFTDPQGPGQNYLPNQYTTLTLRPTDAQKSVQLKFTEFALGAGDNLYVYNGTSPSAAPLGIYSSASVAPDTIKATNASGALTFRFYANGSGEAAGWTAAIGCTSTSLPAPAIARAGEVAAPAAIRMQGLSLAPNPARGQVTIKTLGLDGKPVIIYSSTGKQVVMQAMPSAEATIDLRHLPAGLYLVRCGGQVARLVVE